MNDFWSVVSKKISIKNWTKNCTKLPTIVGFFLFPYEVYILSLIILGKIVLVPAHKDPSARIICKGPVTLKFHL